MMKKSLLMMLFCVTQIVAWGQTGTYGEGDNTATISAEGSTLTISGKGNLSLIGTSTTSNVYKFTWAASQKNVCSDQNGTLVNNDEIYDPAANYYIRTAVKVQHDIPTETSYVLSQSVYVKNGTTYSMKETGAEVEAGYSCFSLTGEPSTVSNTEDIYTVAYKITDNGDNWYGTQPNSWTHLTTGAILDKNTTYYKCSNRYGQTGSDPITYETMITYTNDVAECKVVKENLYTLNGSDYVDASGTEYVEETTYYTNVTFSTVDIATVSSTTKQYVKPEYQTTYYTRSGEEGNYTYTQVAANDAFTGNQSDYYVNSTTEFTYSLIAERTAGNDEVLTWLSNNYCVVSGTVTISFWDGIASQIKVNGYTSIIVKNDENQSVKVTPEVTQSLLYPSSSPNNNISSLDLSATTMTTLASAFVRKVGDTSLNNSGLTKLVLPSSVTEAIGTNDLKFINQPNLSILDVSYLNLSDDDAKKVNGLNNYTATLNVIEKDGFTADELVARYTGSGLAAVFSKNTESTPVEMNVNLFDHGMNDDKSAFTEYATGYPNVIVAGTAKIDASFITKVKACTGIKNLVLAKTTGGIEVDVVGQTQEINVFSTLTLDNVTRVILPDGTVLSNVNHAADNAPILQVYDPTTQKVTIDVNKTGSLATIADYHYYSTDIDNAYWQEYRGTLNKEDIHFLYNVKAKRLNFAQATYYAGENYEYIDDLKKFHNDYVEYLALPDLGRDPVDPLFEDQFVSTNESSYCKNLKAMGEYTASTKTMTLYSKEEGSAKHITEMLSEVTHGNIMEYLSNIKFSGNLNAEDIYSNTTSAVKFLGGDGHLHLSPAVDEYATVSQTRTTTAVEGLDNITKGALEGSQGLVSIDLSDAIFSHYEDMTLSKLGIAGTPTAKVKIPTSSEVKDIPADFMNISAAGFDEIMIPSNIERIHARAFAGDIKHVWTNDVSMARTAGEIINDHGVIYTLTDGSTKAVNYGEPVPEGATFKGGTYTFSSNLKFIGSGAFTGSTHIYDVYNHAVQAPECCVDAFSTVAYVANNTYHPEFITANGMVTRDAYQKEKAWMTVLHFPTECTNDQVKLYKDVTRVYSIASTDLDDKGKTIYYPTQCEWNRSFHQGTTGYLWYAYCSLKNEGTGSSMGFYESTEGRKGQTYYGILYETGKSHDKYQTDANAMYNMNDYDAESKKKSAVFYSTVSDAGNDETEHNAISSIYYDSARPSSAKSVKNMGLANNSTLTDYRGWHQFVLSAYSNTTETTTGKKDFSDFTDDDWWTICEPFYMTKAEIKQVFGENTIVKKLVSVTRDIANQRITLNFGANLVETAENNDDHVIEAGVPYMIKPGVIAGTAVNPDNRILEYVATGENVDERFTKDYTATELMNMVKNGQYTVDAIVTNNTGSYTEPTKTEDGKTVHANLTYTFVGTFWKYVMPRYCYYLGWDKTMNNGAGGVSFFWKSNDADATSRKWNAYTAIIVPNWSNPDFYTPKGVFETIHYDMTNDLGKNDDYGKDNGTGNSGSAKRSVVSNFMGEEPTSTGISVKTAKTVNNDTGIYNISGQKVNNTNLKKGIYISNGKKFVVK